MEKKELVNIHKFEAKLIGILTEDERAFYEKYIDYIDLEDDVWRPVLKLYFNENNYILDELHRGIPVPELGSKLKSIDMIARSLFERMFGFDISIKHVTYDDIKKERKQRTRLGKAMPKFEMLEMENEQEENQRALREEKVKNREKNKILSFSNKDE